MVTNTKRIREAIKTTTMEAIAKDMSTIVGSMTKKKRTAIIIIVGIIRSRERRIKVTTEPFHTTMNIMIVGTINIRIMVLKIIISIIVARGDTVIIISRQIQMQRSM